MKIYAGETPNKLRYPSWSVFTKLWKNTIFPILKQNLTIVNWDHPGIDEDYILSVKDLITSDLLFDLCVKISDALTEKGFIVEQDDAELTIHGKSFYAPEIIIDLYKYEPDDDGILYGYDDMRWNDPLQAADDMSFNPSYQQYLDERGLEDHADNILKGTYAERKAYCEWVRSTINDVCVSLTYVE